MSDLDELSRANDSAWTQNVVRRKPRTKQVESRRLAPLIWTAVLTAGLVWLTMVLPLQIQMNKLERHIEELDDVTNHNARAFNRNFDVYP